MHQYKAPLRDTRFLIHEVLDFDTHYSKLPNGGEATRDVVDAIVEECGRFSEEVISPLYQSGDEEGCKLEDGKVTTPKGFKEAYNQFVEGGWPGLSHPEEFGGQGLPLSLGIIKAEMMGTANWAWAMYPGLSLGAMNTIMLHGNDEQKATYLSKLVSGEWMGTMCLTEPHCGTDLGQARTIAEPQENGTYKVNGTKIFISSGDHDLTENIVHVVLARLPGAPKGTRGISLFIIPKYKVNADGSCGDFNNVNCGSLEHKMGIKASSTAVLNFDGAEAYMIGPENKGLECMFTFMNTARIGTALQGIGSAELAYQGSTAYALDRRSMRSVSGKKEPDEVADRLIHHGDVRRMLLTQRVIAEGGRMMAYQAALLADHMVTGDEKAWAENDDKLGFLTPILKGFLTEMGCEAAYHGMQVFGGHGYIKEWGMEQIARDARISTLYEGTTGIQGLDLLGRKVLLGGRGKAVRDYGAEILGFCRQHNPVSGSAYKREMRPFVTELARLVVKWNWMTGRILLAARKDREIVASAHNDFLMFSGYVVMAYMWARQAAVALKKLDKGGDDTAEFYRTKVQLAEFYFERILPRQNAHAESMLKKPSTLMQISEENFVFE